MGQRPSSRVELTKISLPRARLSPALLVHQTQDQPPPPSVQSLPGLGRQQLLERARLCRQDGRLWDREQLGMRGDVPDRDQACPHPRDLGERRQTRDGDACRGEEGVQRQIDRGVVHGYEVEG